MTRLQSEIAIRLPELRKQIIMENEEKKVPSVEKTEDAQETVTKLAPLRRDAERNEIYVSRQSFFPALCKRASFLLDDESIDSVVIHGLGAAIYNAVRLATVIKDERGDKVVLDPSTSTEMLVDDVQPADGEAAFSRARTNSAIHIRVTKVKVSEKE